MKIAHGCAWTYLVMWARLYFGFHYLESGLYYALFRYVPDFSHAGKVGAYIGAMADVGFYQMIKYLEVLLGTLLVIDVAVPMALLVMAGISVTIVFLNLFVSPDPRELFTGFQELLLNGALLLAYGGYYANFCRLKAKPFWFWDGMKRGSFERGTDT